MKKQPGLDKGEMLIGELSQKAGVPAYTIRYYVKKGLLFPPTKIGRTRAIFNQDHLERLLAIKEIRRDFNSPLSFVRKELGETRHHVSGKNTEKATTGNKRRNSGASHDDKKNLIMDAAMDLFSRQGYHRTNIRDVADHLGISAGTLYLYFGNKQELLLQVADRIVKRTIEAVAQKVAPESDLIKVMYLRSRAFQQTYENFNGTLAQLRAESGYMGTSGQNLIKQIHIDLIGPLIKEVQQAMDQKIIRESDPEILALTFLTLIEMLCFRLTWDDKYTFDQIYSFLFDLLMNGLAPQR